MKSLKIGYCVYLLREQPVTRRSAKLDPSVAEIYKVISRKTSVTCQVECVRRDVGRRNRVLHESQLKPYLCPHIPIALLSLSSENTELPLVVLEKLIFARPDCTRPASRQCGLNFNSQMPATSAGWPQFVKRHLSERAFLWYRMVFTTWLLCICLACMSHLVQKELGDNSRGGIWSLVASYVNTELLMKSAKKSKQLSQKFQFQLPRCVCTCVFTN